jgi:hypothetical protein
MTNSLQENSSRKEGLHIVLVSVHGLIRSDHLELGRDADTGGQTRYVVELARALGEHKDIARVDLLTRRVTDRSVSADYARPEERLSDKARIVRIDCGEEAYIPKEQLWDSLDGFADNALSYLREHDLPMPAMWVSGCRACLASPWCIRDTRSGGSSVSVCWPAA